MADKEVLKEAKDIAWRPTKMTDSTVSKLLDAFSYSFTDEESCIYADISLPTLKRYIKKNPEFWYQKQILKNKPNIKAKMNKVKAISEGNLQESGWWLERKSRNEFSLKQEVWYTDKEWLDIDVAPKIIINGTSDNKRILE